MARTVDHEHREAVRTRILDAARLLITRDGHERVSLRAVAGQAQLSPAALYEYFDGKDSLLAAIAQRASARLAASMSQATDLRGQALAYMAFAQRNPEDFLLLFSRSMSARRSLTEASVGSPYTLVRDRAHVEFPALDAEYVAYGVWCLAHGAAMLRQTHLRDFDADFEAANAAAIDALLTGYGAR